MSITMILNPNQVIAGKYRIIELIGQGGMQQVYRSEHIQLGKEVAIKTPINPSALKRFKRTAVASARVNHPNVAKTLDYCEIGNISILVEELIDGPDLQQGLLAHAGALDPSLVAKILHHLAKGVAASHQADVVHRDLKPNNVMITG
jgi:serine/threonine-protein kinase